MAFVQLGRTKKKDKLVTIRSYKNLIKNDQYTIWARFKNFFRNIFTRKSK
jgi:hypothetical protein